MTEESQEILRDSRSTFVNSFETYQSKTPTKDYEAMPQAEQRTELLKDLAEGSVLFSRSTPSEFQHGQQHTLQKTPASASLKSAPLKRQAPPEFQQGQHTNPKPTFTRRFSRYSEPPNCPASLDSLERQPATQQATWTTGILNQSAPSKRSIPSKSQQAQPKFVQISSDDTATVASAPRWRPKSPDRQQGQPTTPIHMDDDEERLVQAKSPTPVFTITADFMVAYAGPHTLQLESQHRRYRSSNIAPHGDICVVCAAKKDTYVDRFACCSLKFCTDCVTCENGKSLLEIDRFCPLCFKRGWNHMRPYFGSESPVWKLLPAYYKDKYMALSQKVLETTVRLVPEWQELQKLPDDGSLVSDRLILHFLQPYSISQYGKAQLTAFAAECTMKSGLAEQEGAADNKSRPQEPNLQWFVSRPMLPLVRFDKTIAAHEEYIELHQSVSNSYSLKKPTARPAESITNEAGSSQGPKNLNANKEGTTEKASSCTSSSPRSSLSSSPEQETSQVRQHNNFAERARCRIAYLKEMLDSKTCELNAQKKICTQDHIPDLAAFGIELARARGIARGNVQGVETRLQGDYLSKLPVQRLLDNPIFDKRWVQGPKRRKQADNGVGWVVEEVAVKIEDDD